MFSSFVVQLFTEKKFYLHDNCGYVFRRASRSGTSLFFIERKTFVLQVEINLFSIVFFSPFTRAQNVSDIPTYEWQALQLFQDSEQKHLPQDLI